MRGENKMKHKKKTSLVKFEANQKNALSSTGPKTPVGKGTVKWNALKHGLLSKEVVIQAGDGKESKTDYMNMHARLWRDLQPVGALEEILVEKISICYWRLRRVLRCEVGEIRKHLDSAWMEKTFQRLNDLRHNRQFALLDESRQRLETSTLGILHLVDVLDDVRALVDEMGYIPEEAQKKLFQNFGAEENQLPYWCLIFSSMATEGPDEAKKDPEKFGKTPPPEACKGMILKLIDEEKEKLEGLKEFVKQKEELEDDARLHRLVIPEKEAVEKILRYETTIERQLYRAMNQLERLQRQRKGEPIPPPISVELSGEK
jgi:hypothetical protein